MKLIWFLCAFLATLNIYAAEYIGNESCIDCHKEAVQDWQGSDHDKAMQHANADSVLGDFNNVSLDFEGKTNRFFQQDKTYWVNIEGPDGQFHDYQIIYTFGFEPLQQYMVQFEDGRVQLIPFAWDTRPLKLGGQRWYHLYPNMKKSDEFYWTNPGQNWNYMCADCHSTNLNKNYDAKTDSYNSTWSEINVSCEACHGPASEHLNWSKQQSSSDAHSGFDRNLDKFVKNWVYKKDKTTLQPESIQATDQINVCAQCHSRRSQINNTQSHVKGSLLDSYLPSLISAELYHNDGQIYDENYVYGSFMQSKMAEKGVTCSNCHNPHSTKLEIPEEAVCNQCHLATEYTAEKHSFHESDSEASKCTTCHMPETTYMGIDKRRDHSWKIPRPDLSINVGTPNVCTQCHQDKDNNWADKQVGQWFPNSSYRNQSHFSVAFYATEINYQGVETSLAYIAQDTQQAAIIRASSLQRLAPYNDAGSLTALTKATKNNNELIRLGAIQGSASYTFQARWKLLSPLLTDPVLAIRSETAGTLTPYWPQLSSTQRAQLQPALNEYIKVQQFNADRGFARTNIGNVYRAQGELIKAQESYSEAIAVEPHFANSYINLADLYRAQGKQKQALKVAQQGIKAQPKSGDLRYSAGLSLLRLKNKRQAVDYFKQATEVNQNNALYWYVYGLSLEAVDKHKGAQALAQAFKLSANAQHLYAQCDMLIKAKSATAKQCITQLQQFAPKNVIEALNLRLDQQ